jgi:hypothetical protein
MTTNDRESPPETPVQCPKCGEPTEVTKGTGRDRAAGKAELGPREGIWSFTTRCARTARRAREVPITAGPAS